MSEWWQTFFDNEDWLAVQRGVHPPEASAEQAALVGDLLGLEAGSRVLDAPCGEGRIAVELAALGCRVTGIDRSGPLLADARRAADARGVDVTWAQGDLRDVMFRQAFDAAVCFWGSFGYFGDEDDARFAGAMAEALVPGGRWLIDTHAAETLLPSFTPKSWWGDVEPLVLEERRYDPGSARIHTRWTFVRADGTRSTASSAIRLYTAAELTRLVRRAGFSRVDLYGDLHGGDFDLGAHRLALVATR